jgi:hypothetical protein
MLIRKQIQSGNHYLGHTVHNKESELRKKKKKKNDSLKWKNLQKLISKNVVLFTTKHSLQQNLKKHCRNSQWIDRGPLMKNRRLHQRTNNDQKKRQARERLP